jgi:hypothetical protein
VPKSKVAGVKKGETRVCRFLHARNNDRESEWSLRGETMSWVMSSDWGLPFQIEKFMEFKLVLLRSSAGRQLRFYQGKKQRQMRIPKNVCHTSIAIFIMFTIDFMSKLAFSSIKFHQTHHLTSQLVDFELHSF